MSKQRASMHNGKKSQKTGKVIRPPHNDTDREKNENVKKEWVKNNIYYNYYDGEYTPENQKGKMPFREAEIAYYNEHYKDALYAQNERHIKARQKNRVKSMEDWLDSPRYAPTESILRMEKAFAMQKEAAEAEEKAEKETEKALAMQTEATEMKETAEQQIRECQILSEEIVRSAEQIQEVAKQQQEANEQIESKRKELEQRNEIVLSQRKQELEEEYAKKEAEMNKKIALADKRSEAAITVYNKSQEYRLKINEFVKGIKDDTKRAQAETEVKKINRRYDDYELDEQVKLIKQKQMWDKGMSR